jgi:hypothetical protein
VVEADADWLDTALVDPRIEAPDLILFNAERQLGQRAG